MTMRHAAILLLISTLSMARSEAATPPQISIQGKLTDAAGVPLPAGTQVFEFSILDAQFGGTLLWSEGQSIVSDAAGLWSGSLGAVTPLHSSVFTDTVRWLEITVMAEDGSFATLPRVRLITGPYAHRVATVDGAAGGNITGSVTIGSGHFNTGVQSLVVGTENYNVGDWSVIAGGKYDSVTNDLAVVAGGLDNDATAEAAFVGGGKWNRASGNRAVVGGGQLNTASGLDATVAGGASNHANGLWSTVGGGLEDTALDSYTTVGGGFSNSAHGAGATIAGGGNNHVNGLYSTIAGGWWNLAFDSNVTVAGGSENLAYGNGATVGGGRSNWATGAGSTAGGGIGNQASGFGSTIGGGDGNATAQNWTTVGGGYQNLAGGSSSFVGGGYQDTAWGYTSVIGGGYLNFAGNAAAVVGGSANRATEYCAFAGAGNNNQSTARSACVLGGESNVAGGYCSSVGGGWYNFARGRYATVPGGSTNQADSTYCFAAGYYARALHPGCFVWGDSTDTPFSSTANNQFLIRAGGGVGIGTNAPAAALDIASGKLRMTGGLADVEFTEACDFTSYITSAAPTSTARAFGIHTSSSATALVTVLNNGRVGIGVAAPANILQVQQLSPTDPIADSWGTYSSRRWKENIVPIEGALTKVQRLVGVEYDWKANGEHDIGLIAEAVGEVVPEAVAYEENGVDARSVDYARLVALLIEGMKEQQRQIEELRSAIRSMAQEQ